MAFNPISSVCAVKLMFDCAAARAFFLFSKAVTKSSMSILFISDGRALMSLFRAEAIFVFKILLFEVLYDSKGVPQYLLCHFLINPL